MPFMNSIYLLPNYILWGELAEEGEEIGWNG